MSDVTKACRDMGELSAAARAACSLFLAECEKAGLNVLITETYRSQERQDWLYGQGRTRGGNIVTWTRNSRHTSRRAWDICKNVKGQEYSDHAFFQKAGQIAKTLGITWGGDWDSPDKPHFEMKEGWKVPKGVEEMVEKGEIIVNGTEYEVEMIRKDGITYVKTRDMAAALGMNIGNKGKVPVLEKE